MMDKTLTEAIEEKLDLIEPTLKVIEAGGDPAYLQDLQGLLRQHLTNLLVLIERNPGIEAATVDLFATAAAVVGDSAMSLQPPARKRRLLTEASTRFRERVLAAKPRSEGTLVALSGR